MELFALYFGRTILLASDVSPMADEMERGFDKLETALPDGAKRFLDQLPILINAKRIGTRKQNAAARARSSRD